MWPVFARESPSMWCNELLNGQHLEDSAHLREMVKAMTKAFMSTEPSATCGVLGKPSTDHVNRSNGYLNNGGWIGSDSRPEREDQEPGVGVDQAARPPSPPITSMRGPLWTRSTNESSVRSSAAYSSDT